MTDALFELADFEPKPVYNGRPDLLTFTREYFTRDEWEAARPFFTRDRRHWSRGAGMMFDRNPAGCELVEYAGDLRCSTMVHGDRMFWRQASPMHFWEKYPDCDQHPRCECVGTQVTLIVCERCSWHVVDSGHAAVLAWLDHAWPGWRELPIIPAELTPPAGGALIPRNGSPNPDDVKAGKAAHAWAVEHYPAEWQTANAPARAYRRKAEHAGGAIRGYSPFGGFLVYERSAG